jgi:hypothetical protein
MPMQTSILSLKTNKLLPLYRNAYALELPINLGPGAVFARGTVLGQVTGSANDVQTITMGTATGGSFTLTINTPLSSGVTAGINISGISNATIQAAILAVVGTGNAVVTGAGPYVVTFQGALANMPVTLSVITSSVTGGTAPTIAKTTTGRTANTYIGYLTGAGDGSQVAKCILPYDCATDGSGNITLGAAATGGFYGETVQSIDAYFRGIFDTTQLVGLDAGAVAQLGRLWSGTAAAGVLEMH